MKQETLKFDELLEKLNKLDIRQKSGDFMEDIPNDIWKEYFKGKPVVKSNLDVDKHRYYETSVTVIKIFDRYLGIRSVTDMFSEQMDISDCYHTLVFFEMKKVETITFEEI